MNAGPIHVLYTPMDEEEPESAGTRWCFRCRKHEEKRAPAGTRWCFRCRKHLPHDDVLMACADPMSYYDPHWRRECPVCKGDYSTFPGTCWEWEVSGA